VDQKDVERIARAALKELGVTPSSFSVTVAEPGVFAIDYGGAAPLKVRCGAGSTAQWVRNQVFEQFLAQH
jgi:hypothetical protein